MLAAAALEIGAGVALIAGWRVAASAGALALFSLATALIFHADFGDENQAIPSGRTWRSRSGCCMSR